MDQIEDLTDTNNTITQGEENWTCQICTKLINIKFKYKKLKKKYYIILYNNVILLININVFFYVIPIKKYF